MRLVICYISLLATGFALVGCGQSGALQLPNDQNYDKRSKYCYIPMSIPKSSLNRKKQLRYNKSFLLHLLKRINFQYLNASSKGYIHEFYPH